MNRIVPAANRKPKKRSSNFTATPISQRPVSSSQFL
jgi:hypothetical protein